MIEIQQLTQQSRYGWSCIYDNKQYYIQLDDCKSQVDVYVYNDVVGGYQFADARIVEQIIKQLDFEDMYETQCEQDEIPCVNMSLCDIYLNVMQD